MKKLLLIIFAIITLYIISLLAFNSDNIDVTFILESPSLSANSHVYLVGSHRKLGDWQPDQIKMSYFGTKQGSQQDTQQGSQQSKHRWQKTLSFAKGEILEYKFTQGSWANEGANEQGLPLENNYLTVSKPHTVTTEINYWRTTAELPVQGQITGTVKYHRQLTGQGVLPRDIIVWLPPDYLQKNQQNTDKRYPVLYMHDGQNIIDPNTASFKVDWAVDETLTRLIAEKKVPPMIVVGMNSTANRRPEYSPGADGEAYMNFIINKVKPLIDKTYRTKTNREHTFVGGSSMGGIISLMLAWQHNDVFSKALCMSPAFKIGELGKLDRLDYVTTIANYQGPKKQLKLYIDNGGLGLELRLQPGINDMLVALKKQGYQDDLMWVLDSTGKHTEAAWAKRFPDALVWLMTD